MLFNNFNFVTSNYKLVIVIFINYKVNEIIFNASSNLFHFFIEKLNDLQIDL